MIAGIDALTDQQISEPSRRIAWITTDLVTLDDPDRDIGPVTEALKDRNIVAEPVRWRESGALDWSGFDAVVIRSPWDYPEHLEAFLAWLAGVEDAVPVFNEPDTIRWNLDKTYLAGMAAVGVPVVPTMLCDTEAEVCDELDRLGVMGHGGVVVKPNVSAGSRDTGLFTIADPGASALAGRIIASRRRVVVQPEITSVATHGERGMIVIDGTFSHAIVKGPILEPGGGLLGGTYSEAVAATSAEAGEIDLAEGVVAACPGPVPLYARIDLVTTADGPALLEAELFEPSLFCDLVSGSAERFATAIAQRLSRIR